METKECDVVYLHSEEILHFCNRPPKIKGRSKMVHRLLDAYGLLQKMRIENPPKVTTACLKLFHSKEYISCIEKICECFTQQENQCTDDCNSDEQPLDHLAETYFDLEDHGLAYDCQPFKGMLDYMQLVAGSSMKSAEILNSGDAKTVINLYGGWHHAHRDSASGFCYVNDIVLAILKLKERYKKILYVDLDIHHGDGVEEAFLTTDKVMTVSFHKFENGYFPGTGKLSDIGNGSGKYYNVNIPLREGVNDEQYVEVFSRVMRKVKDVFHPEAVVCQCGADCLNGDPLGGFNLTNRGLSRCVKLLKDWNSPLLILGGGGYNFPNTAKAWTYLVGSLLNVEIDKDIPDHEYFAEYAPVFDINITPSVRRSCNSEEYLKDIVNYVSENLQKIVPRNALKVLEVKSILKNNTEHKNGCIDHSVDVMKNHLSTSKLGKRPHTATIEVMGKDEKENIELDYSKSINIANERNCQLHTTANNNHVKIRRVAKNESDFMDSFKQRLKSKDVNKLFEFDEDY